jgi:hypothetical protein
MGAGPNRQERPLDLFGSARSPMRAVAFFLLLLTLGAGAGVYMGQVEGVRPREVMQPEFDHDRAVMDAAEGCRATHPGAAVGVQGQHDFVVLLGALLLLSRLRSASGATARQEGCCPYNEEKGYRGQRGEASLARCPSHGTVAYSSDRFDEHILRPQACLGVVNATGLCARRTPGHPP